MSRLGRAQPIPPISWHGLSLPGPGPVGTTPPRPLVVDRVDQRVRYRPLDPLVYNSGLAAATVPAAPAATPPAPLVVPAQERRRLLVPVEFSAGFDDVTGPRAVVVEPTRARRFAGDSFSVNSALIAAGIAPFVQPPSPLNVDRVDQRVRYRPLDALVLSGVLIPFTPPPPTGTPLRTLLGVGL